MLLLACIYDIVLGDGNKSLSFKINAYHLGLYDHYETSPMCVFVCNKIGSDELYRHEAHILKDKTFCLPMMLLHGSLDGEAHDKILLVMLNMKLNIHQMCGGGIKVENARNRVLFHES